MTNQSSEAISPCFFGPEGRSLYGCYHAPAPGKFRGMGIVVCYPFGHEYIHAHRALRQLAIRVARSGFPVLRFDYFSTGDSLGETGEGSVQQWVSDIGTAIEKVKDLGSVQYVSLVGLRLGSPLSLLAGVGRQDCKGFVLWDPVMEGREYVRELIGLGSDTAKRFQRAFTTHGEMEILGFRFSQNLRKDLEQIDVAAIPLSPLQRVLLLESQKNSVGHSFKENLTDCKVECEYHYLPGPPVWIREGVMIKAWVPRKILDSIVSWASTVCP